MSSRRALLLSMATLLLFVIFFTDRDSIRLKTFRTECGWGYTISIHGKVIIHQPFIPSVGGNIPFDTRKEALRAGRIVLKRLIVKNESSLTLDDLNKAEIKK